MDDLYEKGLSMPTINVNPAILREKARLIRALLEQSKTDHEILWGQMNTEVSLLPKDLRSSYARANNPWNRALTTFYENYLQLALNMEAAADAYEQEEKNIQTSFNSNS